MLISYHIWIVVLKIKIKNKLFLNFQIFPFLGYKLIY